MIETVDRLSLAEELNRQAREAGKVLEVLIQVNEAEEESKSGLAPEQVPALRGDRPFLALSADPRLDGHPAL